MKIKVTVLAIVASILFTTQGFGQITFGVSPGLGFNSAYVGYSIKSRIVPFIGFQSMSAKYQLAESGESYDWETGVKAAYSDALELSGQLLVPNLGIKCFILQKNKLQAYASLTVAKPIISGKITVDEEVNEELKEYLKDISIWGGEFGVGVEYFFDNNFSIGGEFGCRCLNINYAHTSETEIYNPTTEVYEPSEMTRDFNLNLNPTYSRVSLNYYFGK